MVSSGVEGEGEVGRKRARYEEGGGVDGSGGEDGSGSPSRRPKSNRTLPWSLEEAPTAVVSAGVGLQVKVKPEIDDASEARIPPSQVPPLFAPPVFAPPPIAADSRALVAGVSAVTDESTAEVTAASLARLPAPPAPPGGARSGAPCGGGTSPGVWPPLVPGKPMPETTCFTVTVPVVLRAKRGQTLGELRRLLAANGFDEEASPDHVFRCRGQAAALPEEMAIGELPDVRLLLAPESDLEPWQLALAAARARFGGCGGPPGGMPFGQFGPQMQMQMNPLYKTRICTFWSQNMGHCTKGARCVYAHGPGELRQRRPMTPVVLNTFRPFLPPSLQLRPGLPGAPGSVPWYFGGVPVAPRLQVVRPVVPPPPVKPEEKIVFTVDDEEKRRREARAKRFAPRPASFEDKEEEAATPAPQPPSAAELAPAPVGSGADAPGSDGSGPAEEETTEGVDIEDQISFYLLDMQQQYLLGSFDGTGEAEEGEDDVVGAEAADAANRATKAATSGADAAVISSGS